MKKKITVLTLCAMLFALSLPADAQQTGKIFRIGFLDPSNRAGTAALVEGLRQELSKLGWTEVKTSPSSIGLPSKRMIACLSLRRTWFVSRLI